MVLLSFGKVHVVKENWFSTDLPGKKHYYNNKGFPSIMAPTENKM